MANAPTQLIALTNVGDTALLIAGGGRRDQRHFAVDAAAIEAAADAAMAVSAEPVEDLRGTVEYRTAMAGQMTRQAIGEALSRTAGS